MTSGRRPLWKRPFGHRTTGWQVD